MKLSLLSWLLILAPISAEACGGQTLSLTPDAGSNTGCALGACQPSALVSGPVGDSLGALWITADSTNVYWTTRGVEWGRIPSGSLIVRRREDSATPSDLRRAYSNPAVDDGRLLRPYPDILNLHFTEEVVSQHGVHLEGPAGRAEPQLRARHIGRYGVVRAQVGVGLAVEPEHANERPSTIREHDTRGVLERFHGRLRNDLA
jgi:hypothetical protein